MIKLKSQHPIVKLIIASILLYSNCVDSRCLFWVSLCRHVSSQQPPSACLHPTCQWCLHAQQQLRVAGLNSFIVTHLPRGLCCPCTCSSSLLCLPERGRERTCTCHPSCSSPAWRTDTKQTWDQHLWMRGATEGKIMVCRMMSTDRLIISEQEEMVWTATLVLPSPSSRLLSFSANTIMVIQIAQMEAGQQTLASSSSWSRFCPLCCPYFICWVTVLINCCCFLPFLFFIPKVLSCEDNISAIVLSSLVLCQVAGYSSNLG